MVKVHFLYMYSHFDPVIIESCCGGTDKALVSQTRGCVFETCWGSCLKFGNCEFVRFVGLAVALLLFSKSLYKGKIIVMNDWD